MRKKQLKFLLPLAAVIVFAAIGSIFLFSSQAATPFITAEAENGVITGAATVVSDTTAGGLKAIRFGSATPTPSPSPTPTPTPTPGGSCAQSKRVVTAAEVTARTNSGYPAGTQLFVPDGPDAWGGCFPGPNNTGIPAGTQLTAYSGSCTITAANTVITAKTMNCDITVRAANVQIKNSKISASNIFIESGSLVLADSEVNLGNNINGEGLKGNNFTVSRANMYGGKRQVWCNSTCTLEDSFLHDQLSDPSGVTHESAVRVEQYTTLRHNTLLCNAPNFAPDAGCSANQTGYPDFTTIHDNTMDKNLYMATSGGYCSYGGATAGKPFSSSAQNATNVKSTNNVFQRGTQANDKTTIAVTDKRRYTCGYYGVTTAYDNAKAGFLFSGNMWDDGLLFANDTTYPYGGFY